MPLVFALRFLILSVAFLLAAATPVSAQDETTPPADPPAVAPEVPEGLRSPAATLRTFLAAMNAEERGRAAECLDLSLVEKDGAADRAQDLYRCLNRIEFLDFEGDPTLLSATEDTIGDRRIWTYFPRELEMPMGGSRLRFYTRQQRFDRVQEVAPDARIVLARDADGAWRFSAETVRNARSFWEKLNAANLAVVDELRGHESLLLWERIESLWPEALVEHRFLQVKYWQWIMLFVLVLLGVILDFTVRLVLSVISVRAIRRRGGEASRSTLRRTVRPFGLTAAALFWLLTFRVLGLPDEALRIVIPAVKLFAILAMVWSGFRLTDLLAEVASSKAAGTDTRFDDVLIPLVRKALKVFIAIFGLIYFADSLDVPIAPLLTGLGIGGAGFAFAAKDTLEHLFGSVTVIADRPFEVGDWVKIDDVEGTVEELGFRSTRVRTFYNSLVTVPNGNLVRAVVDNFGRRKYRRWSTHLTVTYDTTPEQLEAFCEGVREIIRLHPYTRKDYYQVWLHKFSASSLDILLYMFFEAPDWSTELRERHRLMLDIMRLATRLDVAFAFPTQTLQIERPAEPEASRDETPDTDADRRARATGRRAVRAIVRDAPWRREKPPAYVFDRAEDDPAGEETQIESKVGGSA
ncbi:MAG: mechanosensitive ion channel family protein [Phycisphaerales bacterium]|nr:mechanosensitive ion channel family protein [Phycisphaerales bacterium]